MRKISDYTQPTGSVHDMVKAALADATPEPLTVDAVYVLPEPVQITGIRTIAGIGEHVSGFHFSAIGSAGLEFTASAANSVLCDLQLRGPHQYAGGDIGIKVRGDSMNVCRVRLDNWSGIGLDARGIVVAEGTNANFGVFRDVTATMCGNGDAHRVDAAAFHLYGGDCNGNLFDGCKALDSRRGFFDESFLGNVYVGCRVEGCNDRFDPDPYAPHSVSVGYGFVCKNPNARSTYVGCYVESDSQCDVDYPSTILGGFWSAPNRGTGSLFSCGGVPYLGAQTASGSTLMLGSGFPGVPPDSAVALSSNAPGELPYFFAHGRLPGWWSLAWGNGYLRHVMRWSGDVLWAPNLRFGQSGVGFRMEVGAPGGQPADGDVWHAGDVLWAANPGPGDVSCWRYDGSQWRVAGRIEP